MRPGRFVGGLVRSMRQIYAEGAVAQVREPANSFIGEFWADTFGFRRLAASAYSKARETMLRIAV
jgi:hypothetical protein